MAQLYVQWDHDPEPFVLSGAAQTTAVSLVRPLTVHYSSGGSDVISEGTVATLADGSTHIFDRSTAIYVILTTPGSGTLTAVPESQLAGISGDYAPILRVLRHGYEPYQPMQPGGAAAKSGAWSGGATISAGDGSWSGSGVVGSFDSGSWSGGGTA